ncbi:MAG: putative metal-binding motif-containing protein [Sandaracinaceae bacterium]|nr:putative metal-binding motif-containing protein [Sandaracinaceae bacterium]
MLDRRTLRFAILLLVIPTACGGGGEPPPDGGTPDATPQGDGGGTVTCRFDDDCLDGLFCDGMEFCDPSAAGADERGCVEPGSPCAGDEICEEESDRCRVDCPVEPDMDGDGHLAVECGGDDCDDSDAARYPGNPEICDAVGHDEDCNPSTVGFVDADGDGAGSAACCNGTLCGPDCDDTNAAINPGEVDGPPLTCDGLDNDCDGTPDEGCPCIEGATAECGTPVQIMRIGLCRPGTQLCSAGAWTETCIGGATPQEELCDEQDNDCDAMTDEGVLRAYYVDADADGYGVADDPAVTGDEPLYACSQPAGYARNTDDCDDTRTGVSPAASEVCNGIDDNCDGTTDEGLRASFYQDADGDGFGSTAMTTMACTAPPGYVTSSTDCDDARASVNPAALELCDGVDNNCDTSTDPGCECSDGATPRACGSSDTGACQMGTQRCVGGTWAECVGAIEPRAEVCNGADDDCDGMEDEGLVVTPCYLDADSDGRGSGPATTQCEDPARTAFGRCPSGYSNVAGDCNDANASIRPGATESCNGADDDCDGTADEGVRNTYYLDADSDGFGVTGVDHPGVLASGRLRRRERRLRRLEPVGAPGRHRVLRRGRSGLRRRQRAHPHVLPGHGRRPLRRRQHDDAGVRAALRLRGVPGRLRRLEQRRAAGRDRAVRRNRQRLRRRDRRRRGRLVLRPLSVRHPRDRLGVHGGGPARRAARGAGATATGTSPAGARSTRRRTSITAGAAATRAARPARARPARATRWPPSPLGMRPPACGAPTGGWPAGGTATAARSATGG